MRPAALLLALPALASAQPAFPVDSAGLTVEDSHLGKGAPDWNSATLQLSRQWDRRTLFGAELTETRRFGLRDTEAALAGALPLAPDLTFDARVAASPTHRVLARGSAAAGLQWEFSRAWLLHGALKQSRYVDVQVTQGSLMLEHYFGNFSALAAAHAVFAFGQANYVGELRAAWYYADASSAGLIASAGNEAAQVAPGTVALAPVRSLALVGKHTFAGGPWALRWGLHQVRQGHFYTRRGATLGVQRDF